MSSTSKKKYILNKLRVGLGCGGGCRRPKLSAVFHPRSSSSSWDTATYTTSSAATDTDSDARSLRAVQGLGRLGGGSVAVEKESDDPYQDFRRSMLQMIMEKEIYGKEDLKELLNCFLRLNDPYYHGIIVRAFTEIWNGVCSGRAGSTMLHGYSKPD